MNLDRLVNFADFKCGGDFIDLVELEYYPAIFVESEPVLIDPDVVTAHREFQEAKTTVRRAIDCRILSGFEARSGHFGTMHDRARRIRHGPLNLRVDLLRP